MSTRRYASKNNGPSPILELTTTAVTGCPGTKDIVLLSRLQKCLQNTKKATKVKGVKVKVKASLVVPLPGRALNEKQQAHA